jgi:hypothetical protein
MGTLEPCVSIGGIRFYGKTYEGDEYTREQGHNELLVCVTSRIEHYVKSVYHKDKTCDKKDVG